MQSRWGLPPASPLGAAPDSGPSTAGDFSSALATVTVELLGALWADASVTRRPEQRSSNHRSKGRLREVFQAEPPTGAREALRRLVVSIPVVTLIAIAVRLLFEAFGWSGKFGTAVGLGLAMSIVGWHFDRHRGAPHRGTNDGS